MYDASMNISSILIRDIETPVHIQVKRKKNSSARLRAGGLYIYLSHLDRKKEHTIAHFISWAQQKGIALASKVSLGVQLLSHLKCTTCYGDTFSIIIEKKERKLVGVRIQDAILRVQIPLTMEGNEREVLKAILRALVVRYKSSVCSELFALQEEYFPEIKLTKGDMRYLTSRWGSYNGRGEIRLSSALLLLPREYLTYVMVHELAHGVHMDHSKAFWSEVERVFPEYRRVRKELKRYEV